MTIESAPPALFVVFGGTGDLAQKKLLPALGRLEAAGRMGEVHVLGVARDRHLEDAAYRAMAFEAMKSSGLGEESIRGFVRGRLHYQSIGEQAPEDFAALGRRMEELEAASGLTGNRAFYLALPTRALESTVAALGEAGLNAGPGFTRIVLEKPFGSDLASARALVESLHEHFKEEQIYRIDHYLGKETVQNLLAFRFGNPIFESLWTRDRIQAVQITVSESVGVGRRAGYYDGVGAL
ncbi:MAG: glucose-6-phosphate dehydrogenase, partial [Polyangia bacterium]|nr:glucose-6-phosphate dehydrogenase [Polyangia bacterium]